MAFGSFITKDASVHVQYVFVGCHLKRSDCALLRAAAGFSSQREEIKRHKERMRAKLERARSVTSVGVITGAQACGWTAGSSKRAKGRRS